MALDTELFKPKFLVLQSPSGKFFEIVGKPTKEINGLPLNSELIARETSDSTGATEYITLYSLNGQRWKIFVTDDGKLETEAL